MGFDEIQPYEHNVQMYLLVGLWPYEKPSKKLKRVSVVTFFASLVISVQTYLLFTSKLKIPQIIEILQIYLPTICFSTCYYNMLCHTKTLKVIRKHIVSDFDNLTNEEELTAMMKYVNQNKVYTLAIACAVYLYVGFLVLPSFRDIYLYASGNGTELKLPIRIEYFYYNKNFYIPILMLQFVSMSILSTVGITHYTMVIACLQHACGLFTVVTVKIDQCLQKNFYDHSSVSSSTKHGREFDWIVSVIKYYDGAVNFVKLLTDVYKWSYCVEAFLAILFLILDFLQIFRLLDMTMTRNEAIQNSFYIAGSILVIYTAFYMCQKLIDHSFNVYEKCCQVPFYAISIKTQKLLMFLILRSLKPCTINISGMMVTSHEAFAKLANASYSLAIMCYRMR